MSATIRTSPVLLQGEAPERATAVRAEREAAAHERTTTVVWTLAAALLGAAAAAGTAAAVVSQVVLPIHI